MEKYSVNYSHWESTLKEFGDDFVSFHITISPENEEPFDVSIQYTRFKKQLMQMNPDIYQLLVKAEKSSAKWGPNQSACIKELESYGIDIAKLIMEMVPDIFNIEAEIKWMRNLIANPPDLQDFLSKMKESVAEIKKINEVYYHLCTEIEKTLSQKVIELYPVLVNSSPEYITKLGDIFSKHIPNFANDIFELISKAEEDAE